MVVINIKLLEKNNSETEQYQQKVAEAEIKLSLFFASHNIAINLVDDMVDLLKDIGKDPKVVNDIKLGRTKCTNIIENVLCGKETRDLVEVLKNNYFSVLIDESTDISVQKFLCVLVRFVCPVTKNVKTDLLEMIKLDARLVTSEKLYEHFSRALTDKSIPLSNIIGLASDGANVMLGDHNSFKTRLSSDSTVLVVLKCICHSAALVASKACKQLPRTPEDLIRSVATYISGSAKRCAELLEFQEYYNDKKLKILHLSGTRWLSMYQCVERFLKMWDILKSYFQVALVEDR
ncbi:uncharacterized protein LOC111691381 [Anoplophora glabripennis]|uniref:uncharacterized protein LOC111691381 n=1 Tax=Anoplophora glabripennis TaxID=217634 RepID=UPI000C78686F|nr:uncharacterized protein LOC111691381 [Anoplophora glabripennis]